MLSYELKILAMKHYCELLLNEFQLYEEAEVLQEVTKILLDLEEIGETQGSYSVKVEALILQSKLTLLTGELDSTLKLLEKASTIANDKGMILLQNQVKEEILNCETEFEKWRVLVDKGGSSAEKIKLSKCMEYINYIQENLDL